MTSKSKSSEFDAAKINTIAPFDRGTIQIRNHSSKLTESELISLQLLFYALLDILSLTITNNDAHKSRLLFQLLLRLLTTSKILPKSMHFSAISSQQLDHAQNYVRTLRATIQTALNIIQKPTTTDRPSITSLLDKDYTKALLTTSPNSLLSPSNITIDIPQPDLQLKIPLPMTMNGTVVTKNFDNVVIYRYVQDFYELGILGKGAFGSVFRARNRLDNRIYAIKKIIFDTNQNCRQAKSALREVRVLALLSHPNIIQYHCAWLELVPYEVRTHRTTPPTTTTTQIKPSRPKIERWDSVDEMISFKKESSSLSENKQENDESKSQTKSSSTSDDDGSEISTFELNGESLNSQEYPSDTDNTSFSKDPSQNSVSNKQLIPFYGQNQFVSSSTQSKYINSKIVLFIQMQLCDTTLCSWLRYRNEAIIDETSHENKHISYSLNDLGQQQCWHIYKQLLAAVQYIHSQSFVHRDIKPQNIFISYNSTDPSSVHVRLGDFGLATLFDSKITYDSPEDFINDESKSIGTPLYIPPEQLHSNNCAATTKSDLYSLGIVLFELFNIFQTEMERKCCISNLRIQTKVNEEFSKLYPFETDIIEQLVSFESENRPSAEQILTMYTKRMKEQMKKKQNYSEQMIIEQLRKELRDKDLKIQQLQKELNDRNTKIQQLELEIGKNKT
ncbi:unnamed protein product [Adineta steineri]|uniref:non-specific serine/threonine protein kinase n=1 Tax=Adineta steineri TaxID=433720 RepID=A0A819GJG4_9BILA|nr:unnamed protein product [Adineta steineri]